MTALFAGRNGTVVNMLLESAEHFTEGKRDHGYTPMSGFLYRLKHNKSKFSFDAFVGRYFWIDTQLSFLRYAKSKQQAVNTKIKGIHLGDIIDVKRTAHPKFFVVCGKPHKLTLRAKDEATTNAWITALTNEVQKFKATNVPKTAIPRQKLSNVQYATDDMDHSKQNFMLGGESKGRLQLELQKLNDHNDPQSEENVLLTSTTIKYKRNHAIDMATPRVQNDDKTPRKSICPNKSTVKVTRCKNALKEFGGIQQSKLVSRKDRKLYTGRSKPRSRGSKKRSLPQKEKDQNSFYENESEIVDKVCMDAEPPIVEDIEMMPESLVL